MLFINRFWFDEVLTLGVLNFPFYSQGLPKISLLSRFGLERLQSSGLHSDPYLLHLFSFIWSILFPHFAHCDWLMWVYIKKYTISTVSLSHFLSSSFYLFFLFFSSIHLKFSFYCRVIKIIHPKYKSHFNVILANQTICFFSAPFLLLFGV